MITSYLTQLPNLPNTAIPSHRTQLYPANHYLTQPPCWSLWRLPGDLHVLALGASPPGGCSHGLPLGETRGAAVRLQREGAGHGHGMAMAGGGGAELVS